MGKCPNCEKTIEHVRVFTTEENEQMVFLLDNGKLNYGTKTAVEGSAKKTEVECPHCCMTLLKMKGDGDDEKIIVLLK